MYCRLLTLRLCVKTISSEKTWVRNTYNDSPSSYHTSQLGNRKRRSHQACKSHTYSCNSTHTIKAIFARDLQHNTKTFQFDDLPFTPYPTSTVVIPVPYDGLNFSAFDLGNTTFDASGGGRTITIPKSKPNYIIAPQLFYNPLAANISIPSGSSATSFDLIDFWVGCIDSVLRYATACNIVVNSTSAADGLLNQPFFFTYEPATKAGTDVAPMTKATTNLFDISDVAIGFTDTSPQTVFRTKIFLDSFKYNLPSKNA